MITKLNRKLNGNLDLWCFGLSFIAFLLLMSACSRTPRTQMPSEIDVVKYDGCEYIIYERGEQGSSSYAISITHKGNCRNPIHVYAKSDQQ